MPEAEPSGSIQPETTQDKWRWIPISGWHAAPSRSLWSLSLSPDLQHSPRDSEAPGESQPLSLAKGIPVSPGPPAVTSDPADISHCPSSPTPQTQARRGPKRKPLQAASGPNQPSDPRSGDSSWALHVDAVNTTVQACHQHKAATQNPDTRIAEECSPSLSECILFPSELFPRSLVGVTTDVF